MNKTILMLLSSVMIGQTSLVNASGFQEISHEDMDNRFQARRFYNMGKDLEDQSRKTDFLIQSARLWDNCLEISRIKDDLEDLRIIARIHNTISSVTNVLNSYEKCVKYWNMIFQSFPNQMSAEDCSYAGIACKNAALSTEDPDQKRKYYQKSLVYWRKFLKMDVQTVFSNEVWKTAADCFFTNAHSYPPKKLEKETEISLQAVFCWEKYFEKVTSCAVEDLKRAAQSFNLASANTEDIEFSRRAIRLWERVFSEGATQIIAEDFGFRAKTYHNAGYNAVILAEKAKFLRESAGFWDVFFAQSGEQDNPKIFQEASKTYNQAGFYADFDEEADAGLSEKQREDAIYQRKLTFSQKSIQFWKTFSSRSQMITEKDYIDAANSYSNAASYERDEEKESEYLEESIRLARLSGFQRVFQIGDCIVRIATSEEEELETKPSLQIELSEDFVFEEELLEDLDITERKDESAPVIKAEAVSSSITVDRTAEPAVASEEIEGVIPKKLSKTEKKLLRAKADPTEVAVPLIKKAKTHQVSPLMVKTVREAYSSEKKKENALAQLDKIITCNRTIKEDVAIRYLNTLEKLFLIKDLNQGKGQDRSILGHKFDFHSAHGARGGDWDVGMVHRLSNFAKDVKSTFEAIMRDVDQKI